MYEVRNLSFVYEVEGRRVEVLNHLDFKVNQGDFVGIQGPSGSGKSTLFYILGFLLKPTSGTVLFDGFDISTLSQDQLTLVRNQKIGFVFQQFHLLSKTSTLENVLLPTRYPSELEQTPEAVQAKEKEALQLLEDLGLGEHVEHYPNQLSGGQQQRVAIARALINDVDLILADEPTGNLDSKTAMQILDVLTELNRRGKTIILITHDSEVAKRCSRVYHLKDGAFTGSQDNFPPPSSHQSTESASPKTKREIPTLPPTYSFDLYRRIGRSVFPLVLKNIFRNKAKSLLTMLGVIIGVAAVLAMVTLGQFTKVRILETYETLGVNKLQITGWRNWNLKATDKVETVFREFKWDQDLLVLRNLFPEIVYLSPELKNTHNRALSGGIEIEDRISFMGVIPEYLTITGRTLFLGRSISPFHVKNQSPVCVIGFEVAQRLFEHLNPLGQIVNITDGQRLNVPCEVIGVLNSVKSNKDSSSPPNLNIIMPYTYYQSVVTRWWDAEIHAAVLQVDSHADVEETGKKIKAFFERRYGKSGRFSVDSDSTLIAQMKKFLNIFELLLTAIALLSLIVGGIGINNMMLVSVTERLKEFGIRKALGATNRSIRILVLMESIGLCGVAGLMGVVIGFVSYEFMIFMATKFVPQLKFEWIFEPLAVTLSLASIVAVGIASGLVPAIRAEKLQVIEALRSE